MKLQQGMTLIEVMVALVLLSMLSVGLFASFRVGQRTYAQVVGRNADSREVVSAQRFLRQIIEAAYPFMPNTHQNAFAMQGSTDDLVLSAPAPGYDDIGFTRYHVFVVTRRDGLKDLMVQYGVDRNGATSSADSLQPPEVIMEKLRGIELSYSPPAKPGFAATSTSDPDWQSEWQQQSKFPLLIRVRILFPANDRRVWTELVAAPRVTDAATCEFDVVSQACRGTQ